MTWRRTGPWRCWPAPSRVAREARFTLDFGHGLPNGDWPARLVTQFAAATGGDWQPRGLRCAGPGGGRYPWATIDFTSGGGRYHWRLPPPRADDLLTSLLDQIVAFAASDTPDPDGSLPLHEAARLGRSRIVAELLREGADPRARDGAGRQAIDLATEPATRDLLAG